MFEYEPQKKEIKPISEFPDLSIFSKEESHAALEIPVKQTADLRKKLGHLMWRRPKLKNVYNHESDPLRRILVLSDDSVYENPLVQELLQHNDCRKARYTITFSYEDFTVEEVLRQILPSSETDEIPSSFEAVGSLAHVNLRESQLPYKFWIGKVLLDKNKPRVRTVVNKLGSIETVYRTFGMEVIAGFDGPGWSQVSLKEEGCTFGLDFTKVYWNSRLAGEHRRLVRLIQKHAASKEDDEIVVADLMAGVGPFAVPLTSSNSEQKNIIVHANDLNPDSYKHLVENITRNKCKKIKSYNMCGRAMVHQLQAESVRVHHFLMNLPASAPEFLDAFRGYEVVDSAPPPRIHVHCFAPKVSGEESDYQCAVDRCAKALGCDIRRDSCNLTVHVVRDVSPKKNMLCVSFDLPQEAKNLPRIKLTAEEEGDEEPNSKKPKTSA